MLREPGAGANVALDSGRGKTGPVDIYPKKKSASRREIAKRSSTSRPVLEMDRRNTRLELFGRQLDCLSVLADFLLHLVLLLLGQVDANDFLLVLLGHGRLEWMIEMERLWQVGDRGN